MQAHPHRTRFARVVALGSLLALGCCLGCSGDLDDEADGPGTSSGGTGGNDASSGGASSDGGTQGGGTQGSGGSSGSGGLTGDGGSDMTGSGGADGSGGEDGMGDEVPEGEACAEVADWPEEWSAREEEILVLVNQYRASGATCGGQARPPAEPLTMDPYLRCAARFHSKDMAERDYFSHGTWDESAETCSGDGECASGYICAARLPESSPSRCGKSPSLRVQEIGGPAGAGWENIAAGNSTAADTMQQWMNSPGHCNNIMNGQLRTIGIGYYGGAGTYNHYWTQSFDD